jgi:hypothetical protein
MKRMCQVLCGAAIMLMAGTVISPIYARALFAYPMQGQSPEQENADRAACHDWAVAQSGYDPTLLYAAQRGEIIVTPSGNTLPTYDRRYPAPGGIAAVRGNADIRRLNELYDAYLRAGEVCLEARGYQVTR